MRRVAPSKRPFPNILPTIFSETVTHSYGAAVACIANRGTEGTATLFLLSRGRVMQNRWGGAGRVCLHPPAPDAVAPARPESAKTASCPDGRVSFLMAEGSDLRFPFAVAAQLQ